MKKGTKTRGGWNMPLLAVAAFVVAGSAFAFSSGLVDMSGSSVAAVLSSLFGRPTLMISRDSASPSGSLRMGQYQQLALFDVSARNVSHWVTLHHLSGQIYVVSPQTTIALSNFNIDYKYCIPAGKTYGYGWSGGNCAYIGIQPTVTRTGDGYTLSFDASIPIYPEASPSTLSVSAIPTYAFTGTVNNNSKDAKVQVRFGSGVASGDKCTVTRYGYKNQYGYNANCVSLVATVGIMNAGNLLTVIRPYGYGYAYPRTTRPAPTICPQYSMPLCPNNGTVVSGGVDSRGCQLPGKCVTPASTPVPPAATSTRPSVPTPPTTSGGGGKGVNLPTQSF